jgi:hypothetical protein
MPLVRISSVVVAVSLVVMAGDLGYMVSERTPPFDVKAESLASVRVKPGGVLERRVTYVQRKQCFVHSDRVIVDSRDRRYILPYMEWQAGMGPVGVEQTYVTDIPIPFDIAPGPARYESTTIYKCNPLHSFWPIISPYRPIFFEVVE